MFDVPALRYYLYQNPTAPLIIADLAVSFEDYGFILPLDNKLIRELDIEIVKLKQSGRLEEIIEREIKGDFENQ